MSAQILDGNLLAQQIKNDLKRDVDEFRSKLGRVPKMVNLLIGNDDGSCAYANAQKKVASIIGIEYELRSLPADISQDEFCQYLRKLNDDNTINGIMLHKPVPKHIDYAVVADYVDIKKDLEGINVANIGKMLLGKSMLIPCTPAAVMEHIQSTKVNIRGKEAVVVGASEIVGKPLSLLLLEKYATVRICHIATSEAGRLKDHVSEADILIVAVGKPNLIKGEWVKEGSIVIDVGINRVGDKIVGDVEFETAKKRASFITPVPGGVGPVTVVMLMRNAVEAFRAQNFKGEPA